MRLFEDVHNGGKEMIAFVEAFASYGSSEDGV